MLIRTLAAVAVATFALGAQAGTLQNGVWTPSGCGSDPGAAPEMNGKTGETYNKSAKDYQTWADKAKAYQECLVGEAKTDQNSIVEGTNKAITAINEGSKKFQDAANEAMEKLKKKK